MIIVILLNGLGLALKKFSIALCSLVAVPSHMIYVRSITILPHKFKRPRLVYSLERYGQESIIKESYEGVVAYGVGEVVELERSSSR